MKYGIAFRIVGNLLSSVSKEVLTEKKIRNDIKKTYKDIVLNAGDIGRSNNLIGAYAMAAYFIAMNRCDGLTPEENCRILERGLAGSRLYRLSMGNADSYFSEKHMEQRRKWSEETYKRRYSNDWVVDVIEGGRDFEFGFDYHECGVCKLCRDEGCSEYAKYLCRLDYMTSDIMGIKLRRTMTIAEGYDKCDFRFSRR